MDADELSSFARLRIYISRRRGAPVAPDLGAALAGELPARRRGLSLQQAARLAYAAARLGAPASAAPHAASLGRVVVRRGARREALTVLHALASLGRDPAASAAAPPRSPPPLPPAETALPVFEAFFLGHRGRGPSSEDPAAIAAALRCADVLRCELPPRLVAAAADALRRCRLGPDPPPRYSEALAGLASRDADVAEVYGALASLLAGLARRGAAGQRRLDEWLRQLLATRVAGDRAVFDLGLATAWGEQLRHELPLMEHDDLLGLARVIQDRRASRLGLWTDIMQELGRRLPALGGSQLAVAVDVSRRSPLMAAACPAGFWAAAAEAAGSAILETPPEDLARLLHAFYVALPPRLFLILLVHPHQEAIAARLGDPGRLGPQLPGVLHALANGGGARRPCGAAPNLWPPWWRSLVLRPFAAELRGLVAAVAGGPLAAGGRAAYVKRLTAPLVGDVGRAWWPSVLDALRLGDRPPSSAFLRRALRSTLRRRRATDAVSDMSPRALGFVAWRLCYGRPVGGGGAGEELQERSQKRNEENEELLTESTGMPVESISRRLHEEEDAALLLSANVGFLDKRYRRHGDVERVALLAVLRGLRAAAAAPGGGAAGAPLAALLGGGATGGGEGGCPRHLRITGFVDMYVDRVTCLSCLGVLAQFKRALPRVEVRVACANPPWLPRPLPYQRCYGVVSEAPTGTSLAPLDCSAWDP